MLTQKTVDLINEILENYAFFERNAHTSNLFENLNVLKLPDKVTLENCILICKCFCQSLPKTFEN